MHPQFAQPIRQSVDIRLTTSTVVAKQLTNIFVGSIDCGFSEGSHTA